MSHFILSSKALAQPSSNLQIDWGNPLNAGLIASWEFGHSIMPIDVAMRQNPDLVANINPVLSVGKQGKTVNFTGVLLSNSGYRIPFYPSINTSNNYTEMTVYAVTELTRVNNTGEHIILRANNGIALAFFGAVSPSSRRWRLLLSTSSNTGWTTANDLYDDGIVTDVPMIVGFSWMSSQFFRWFAGPVGGDIKITPRTSALPSGVYSPSSSELLWLCGSASTLNCGYIRPYSMRILSRAVSDAEIYALSGNPWQIFKTNSPVYFDFPAPSGSALTGANCSQANASSTGAVAQSNTLTTADASQASASTTGSCQQTQSLSGAHAEQSAVAGTGGITTDNTTALTGAAVAQSATSSLGAVSQAQSLIGNHSAQANATTTGALATDGTVALTASDAVQTNTATAASLSQAQTLFGTGASQSAACTVGDVIADGTIILTAAATAQSASTGTGWITQSQFLFAIGAMQIAQSSTGVLVLPGAYVIPRDNLALTSKTTRYRIRTC